MRLPRDVGGMELARKLNRFGYEITRQTGSHIRLTTQQHGDHHVTVPRHEALRVGTLNGILAEIAAHLEISRDQLAKELFE